jgi:hypothetical protein
VPANTLKLTRALLAGQTSAGQRVGVSLPGSPVFPAITFDVAGGGRSEIDTRRAETRVRVTTWGPDTVAGDAMAYELALEVEDVMLPPEIWTQGYYGDVAVGGSSVFVYNVVEEVAPTFFEDPSGYARYDTTYRIVHY